jgi:hypothetical protein
MLYRYAPIICLAASVICTKFGRADEATLDPAPQFLVLRNGEVLSGRITRDGDRYVLAGEGSQMRFPSREVDFTCGTLDEAYSIQERRVVAGRIEDRLNLADWCLRQGLTGYAARELSAAMVLDARNPRVALLEGRLQRAIEGEARSADEPIAETTGAAARDTSKSFVSAAELERQMRAMPLGTVEAFTTSIQPLLLRSCATAGCHGAGSTSTFTLMRPPMGSPMPRRMTQRNLSSALTLIDRQQPLDSKLLSAAKDPHGPNQASGAVGLDAAKYQELVAWVWQACNGRTKAPLPLAPTEKAPQPTEQSPVLAAQISREASVSSIPTTKPPMGALNKKSRPLKQQTQPIVSAPGDFSNPPAEAAQGQAAPSTGNVTGPN